MKKTLIVFALAITCVITFSSQTVFASFDKPDKSPNSKVAAAIHHDFPQAQHVIWRQKGKEFIAKFSSEAGNVTATYDKKGKLLFTLISSNGQNMPFRLRMSVNKKYPGYAPQNMTEYISSLEHCYYILLKQQSGNLVKWMRIKTDNNGNIQVLQKLQQTI